MSDPTPSVKLELRSTTKNGSDTFVYRVISAQNTTSPRLGAEMTEKELDKSISSNPGTRHNIVMA